MPSDEELHEARAKALADLLGSRSPRRLIVAGPGTGKTFTFEQVVAQVGEPRLLLTFLNVLVADLHRAIGDRCEVYSFHGFAHRLLRLRPVDGLASGFHYYPPVKFLMAEDARIVDGIAVDDEVIGALFRNLAVDEPVIGRALASGAYYNAVGHDDGVFRVLRSMDDHPSRIPTYAQILVDEYQDFCALEIAFISVLARKSSVLVVGDDDQALFAFRDATPEGIRQLATNADFERYELPYCSRCTEVLVSATHTVVAQAQAIGLLAGRIDKKYVCFMPEKREDSALHPSIGHAGCSVQRQDVNYMGRYIAGRIREIAPADVKAAHAKRIPTALVIGPSPFLPQVEDFLREQFPRVRERVSSQMELDALFAYDLLAKDESSRLAWRVLLQLLIPKSWQSAVRTALTSDAELRDQLDESFVEHHLHVAQVIAALRRGERVPERDAERAATELGVAVSGLGERLDPPARDDAVWAEDEPEIMFTTLMGSKGLEAMHVFIVGVNNGHFPRDNRQPSDAEVCQLLVALTRACKSCTIVSTRRFGAQVLEPSAFTKWLAPHLEFTYIDKGELERRGW